MLTVHVLCFTFGTVFAEEISDEDTQAVPTGITTELDLAYVSKYVWRGSVLNNDPAVQPSLTFTHPNGLSFNWWGTLDTTDIVGQKGNATEFDYTLNYMRNAGKTCINAGICYFTYPHVGSAPTGEVYASACLGGALSPTLSINHDFDQIGGFYISFGVNRDCRLPSSKESPLTLGLSAKIGFGTARYNSGYFGVENSVFNDLLLTASVPIVVNDKLTIAPFLSYSAFINDALKTASRTLGSDPTNFFGGVNFSRDF